MTHHVARFTFYVLLVILLTPSSHTAAQTQTPSYWQYRASGRLQHVITTDMTGDGIDDLIIADENGKVVILDANGDVLNSYSASEPLYSIQTVDTDDPLQSEMEIVLGLRNRLIVVSATGSEIRQIPIKSVATPTDIFTNGSTSEEREWQAKYDAIPISLEAIDWNGDGQSEILVLLDFGQLQLFDTDGNLVWRYNRNSNPVLQNEPHMAVGDIDQDGQADIVLSFFNPYLRFSQLALINRNGRLLWEQEQPISGRVTALTLIERDGQRRIVVGTNLGHVHVYDEDRQRQQYRTVNKPVTALSPIQLASGPGWVVGTDVGGLIAYDWGGRRAWTRQLSPNANRSITKLSTVSNSPLSNQPVLAAVVGTDDGASQSISNPADVVLIASNGRTLDTLAGVEALGPTRLVDVNGDGNNELILTQFATVELLGLGIGASDIASDWDYDLLGQPSSFLVVDFDQDGEDELIVGTENGRIHRLNNNGSFPWVINPGVPISHLLALPNPQTNTADIIVVRINSLPQTDGTALYESWIALRQANGELIWEQALPGKISTLQIGDFNGLDRSEIIVGTSEGDVIVYSSTGSELWRTKLVGQVEKMSLIGDGRHDDFLLIAATSNRLYQIASNGFPRIIAVYPEPIRTIYSFNLPDSDSRALIVFLMSNQTYGITLLGKQLPQWPLTIDGPPTHTLFAHQLPPADPISPNSSSNIVDSFLLATDDGRLRNLLIENGQPKLSWLLTGLGEITSLYWGDLNNDSVSELALGNQNGQVNLYEVAPSARRPQLSDQLNLGSGVFALTIMQRENSQKSDLLAITKNGVVQLFRVKDNRPPLLAKPEIEMVQDRYNLVLSINDVENDDVKVRLEIFNPNSQEWVTQEEQRLVGGADKLFWLVDNPFVSADGVRYRFFYDDGFHQGYVTPPPGPIPLSTTVLRNEPLTGLIIFGFLGLLFTLLYIRQAQSPVARARRFYRDLSQEPASSLVRLEGNFQHGSNYPGFLLSLANQARLQDNSLIASLADGLFLLANQPHAGLPIIINALDEVRRYAYPTWQSLDRWELMFKSCRSLLEAPSVAELALLLPQLEQLLSFIENPDRSVAALDSLLPILTNLRDSKRVELAGDSLVYLNEASFLLNEFGQNLWDYPSTIGTTLAAAIVSRWLGLVGAEIEELQGRADLGVTLQTKRLVSAGQTDVALEIRNSGRAPAENIIATLAENPAYTGNGRPVAIPLLPPGQTRQVSFSITPMVKDRFRLVLKLTYNDRNKRDREIAFGDMVHLLPPVREFKTVSNPYLPGTPLRQNSTIFFGRDELFHFIAESAGHLAQRNVLILVGQRRTGKTSILLRLEHHLPDNLMPVYIDCQSLGVTPGMFALLHDLAWSIADALAARDIELNVPPTDEWGDNPTRYFQRQFLPQVKTLLPSQTTLLLVFDEFEAFENLVKDGILPPNLFPYLRHLMQHSEGLSFIFVGTRRLEEMSIDYWSVLFNIALYQKIGYLEDSVASRLIQEPVAPNLVYDDLAINKILRVTAGHPYFLQLVCYSLVKQANSKRKSYVTISDVNSALDEMLSLGEVHFAYLWQRSTETERAFLTAVSHMMDQDSKFHSTDITQYLESYGIRFSPSAITAALNSLVERDIFREVAEGKTAQYELKIGLVGLWVAKHKSLSHLYMSY